jgi:glycosyltransferase involved in cell wall biosynthesis
MDVNSPRKANDGGRPSIVIYRTALLALSETFVLSQAKAMEHFAPYFVGFRRVGGLSLPEERFHLIGEVGPLASTRNALYRVCGWSPGLKRKLRLLNPLLVHAHFGVDSVPALWLARKLGIPLVVTYHGYDVTMKDEYAREYSYDYRRYLRWRPTIQKEAALFIAVSEFVRSRLINQGFPTGKVAVHYVGVDTELFAPDLSIPRTPIVLFVGRLVDSKGCGYLIQAMAKVQEEIPDAKLVVIGDGPLRNHWEKMASECLLNFSFLGALNHGEVRRWMNQARVFSVPSFTTTLGTSEGFGLVFIEAQAMGLPVASFATGGIPEAVEHGTTGLLARECDVDGLAYNISELLKDDVLWTRFSMAARKRARECFDLKEQTTKLEGMYSRITRYTPMAAVGDSLSIPI